MGALQLSLRAVHDREEHARQDEYRDQAERYRQRLRELRTMPYKEYLQTPEWQERRKARLKAARYRCQVCNTIDQRLNVHHRTYGRPLGAAEEIRRRGVEAPGAMVTLGQP